MRKFTAERNDMRIYGKIALPDGPGPHPLVIFSHGFGASRMYDSGMHERFVERGIAFAAFDFCGGGIGSISSGSPLDMSVLTEAADLNAVIGGYAGDVLIAHGSDVPIVPLAYSERAAKAYGDRARLIVVEGMGHGFKTASLQQYESILSRAADFIGERGR